MRPMTTEMAAATKAILALVMMAGMYVGSRSAAGNQHVVNPFQTETFPICVAAIGEWGEEDEAGETHQEPGAGDEAEAGLVEDAAGRVVDGRDAGVGRAGDAASALDGAHLHHAEELEGRRAEAVPGVIGDVDEQVGVALGVVAGDLGEDRVVADEHAHVDDALLGAHGHLPDGQLGPRGEQADVLHQGADTVAVELSGGRRAEVPSTLHDFAPGDQGIVMVRPERVQVVAEPPSVESGRCVLPVEVRDLVFQGPVLRCMLVDDEGDEILANIHDDARPEGLERGARLWAVWDPSVARLLHPGAKPS